MLIHRKLDRNEYNLVLVQTVSIKQVVCSAHETITYLNILINSVGNQISVNSNEDYRYMRNRKSTAQTVVHCCQSLYWEHTHKTYNYKWSVKYAYITKCFLYEKYIGYLGLSCLSNYLNRICVPTMTVIYLCIKSYNFPKQLFNPYFYCLEIPAWINNLPITKCGINLLIQSQTMIFVVNKWFHPISCWACDYLSMLELIHVDKMGPCCK